MALTGKRILVVEDEPIVSMLVEDILTEEGGIVVGPVGSVAGALKLVETVEIHAGLLDVNINGETSHAVGAALKARGIPFVYATGYATMSADGDVDAPVVQKPYVASQISSLLEQILTGNPN